MKVTVLSFLLLTYCLSSHAQDDFLITLKGDTLIGQATIRSTNFYDEIDFKNDTVKETFKAFTISLLKSGEDSYRPIAYQNKKIMAQIFVEGSYLSAYRVKPEGSYDYSETVLVKSGREQLVISAISFRKRMSNFLKDCEFVAAKIAARELTYNDLKRVVALANESCSKASNPSVTKTQKPETTDALSDAIAVMSDVLKKLDAGESVPAYQLQALKKLTTMDLDKQLANLIERVEEKGK